MNLRIFVSLIHELRVKLDIAKAGLAPIKIVHQIEDGLSKENQDIKRKERMERIILSEFNTINLARVQGAIVEQK